MYKTKSRKRNASFQNPKRKNRSSRPKRRNRRPQPVMDIHAFMDKRKSEKPQKPYESVRTFDDFMLHQHLFRNIQAAGYQVPTEIQDKALDQLLAGKDLIGIAGTGTGKTAAFMIPVIQYLLEEPQDYATLIIAPTRELATQISDEFKKLAKGTRLFATTLIGGGSVSRSIKELRRTNHVVIGTPGRLIDMANRGVLPLNQFKTLVLDEFDRMLDMGFSEDVKFLHERMKRKQQTLLFSATMDKSQRKLVQSMTHNPIEVYASSGTQAAHAVEQSVVKVPDGSSKINVIRDLVKSENGDKVILFCETKRRVDAVSKKLSKSGIPSDHIHGDKSQRAREKALRNLKKGKVHVLVATDVVARGIDISDVALVINYEVPKTYNDYVHRIGRTGRAGKTGKAVTIME